MDEERNPVDAILAAELAWRLEQTQIGKFHTKGGHGFAAEEANILRDRMGGKHVDAVGVNNTRHGPDRIVDGVSIQTKYFQSARLTISDAFDSSTRSYRYERQLLEVPRDQYAECVELMRERIAGGQVPGFTDPNAADQIIKQGDVTYKQARNIARAGNIDSLLFDTESQAVTIAYTFALGFAIHFARAKWSGAPTETALRSAFASGVKTGGVTLIAGIVSAQLLRTKGAALGAVAARDGMKAVGATTAGRKIIERVALGSLRKSVYGAAAINHAAKLMRTSIITTSVVAVVTTGPDFYSAAIARNISWRQFSKNGVVTFFALGAGTTGWVAGAATGATIGSAVPVIGTAAGAIVGGLVASLAGGFVGTLGAKAVMDRLVEDDAKRMTELLREATALLAEDYLLSEAETNELVGIVVAKANARWLRSMWQAGRSAGSSADACRAFAYSAFDDDCFQITLKRDRVLLPARDHIQPLIEQIAAEIARDENRPFELPVF